MNMVVCNPGLDPRHDHDSTFILSFARAGKGEKKKRKGTIGSPFWNRMPVTGSQSVPLLFLTGGTTFHYLRARERR